MRTTPYPSSTYLNECFTYNPISGELFWKERPPHHFALEHAWKCFNTKFAGTEAGSEIFRKNGPPMYVSVHLTVNGTPMTLIAHAIIYYLMGVIVPDGMVVDHKDTNPFNNRWANLRLGTQSQNTGNKIRRRSKASNLPKGVYKSSRHTFRAMITANGITTCLGNHATPELAHAAYCAKATELFGEFARFN